MIFRSCCPLCNDKKFKIIESINSKNKKLFSYLELQYKLGKYLKKKNYIYELRLCLSCGTRYQAYVLDENDNNNFYSNKIDSKLSLIKQFKNYRKNLSIRKKTAKLIKKFLDKNSAKNYDVLEVGAGWGIFAYESSYFDLNFTTLEISKQRRNFHKLLDINTVDSFDTIKRNAIKFDIVYSNQVIEHLSDLKEFIKSCNEALEIGGYFIAEYPSFNNFIHYFFNKNNHFNEMKTKALEHLQLITDKGAKYLFDSFDSFEYIEYFPIRKFGDRFRLIIHFLTPNKYRGKGFIIAKKVK